MNLVQVFEPELILGWGGRAGKTQKKMGDIIYACTFSSKSLISKVASYSLVTPTCLENVHYQ